jgi:hypothetical protein
MNCRALTRTYRVAPLVAALVFLFALVAAPMVSADTTAEVTISASIDSLLSITLCDTEANFGNGLTSIGSAPQNTTDEIGVTSPSGNVNQGVFYSWTPSCQVLGGEKFLKIVSTSSSALFVCATEDIVLGGSPTMSIARSLRWDTQSFPDTTYSSADSGAQFNVCPAPGPFVNLPPGAVETPATFYLRVDPSDQAGTFSSTVVWTVTPA